MTRIIRIICVIFVMIFALSVVVSAESFPGESLNSYTYDYWGNGVVSPDAYKFERLIYNADGVMLSNPTDMFIAKNGNIYVADAGNNRIVVYSQQYTVIKIIDNFYLDGNLSNLNSPNGIFVDSQNNMLIADTKNKRVIKSDANGNILLVLEQPKEGEKDFYFSGIDFLPNKVIEDSNGCIYVLCDGVYQGAIMYEKDGSYMGYFGANEVQVTFSRIVDAIWRKFMTKEQRQRSSKYVPVEFNNMYIDDEGSIYTVTKVNTSENQLKKLNPKGDNILPASSSVSSEYSEIYGDLKNSINNGTRYYSRLGDVTVDSNGFITVIDQTRGRLFQYDSQSNLIVAFGGISQKSGFFGLPVAVDNYNDKIFVLDYEKNGIAVFSLTDYGKAIKTAIVKYNNGDFAASEKLWNNVLTYNNNYSLAYIGMGKIYHDKGDYKTAMKYFKKGGDKVSYATSFKQYRRIILRRYVFPSVGILIIIALVYSFGIKRLIKLRKR